MVEEEAGRMKVRQQGLHTVPGEEVEWLLGTEEGEVLEQRQEHMVTGCRGTVGSVVHRIGDSWAFGNCNVWVFDWMVFLRLPALASEEETAGLHHGEEVHSDLFPDLDLDSASKRLFLKRLEFSISC